MIFVNNNDKIRRLLSIDSSVQRHNPYANCTNMFYRKSFFFVFDQLPVSVELQNRDAKCACNKHSSECGVRSIGRLHSHIILLYLLSL